MMNWKKKNEKEKWRERWILNFGWILLIRWNSQHLFVSSPLWVVVVHKYTSCCRQKIATRVYRIDSMMMMNGMENGMENNSRVGINFF